MFSISASTCQNLIPVYSGDIGFGLRANSKSWEKATEKRDHRQQICFLFSDVIIRSINFYTMLETAHQF